jgi:hypothetical protein
MAHPTKDSNRFLALLGLDRDRLERHGSALENVKADAVTATLARFAPYAPARSSPLHEGAPAPEFPARPRRKKRGRLKSLGEQSFEDVQRKRLAQPYNEIISLRSQQTELLRQENKLLGLASELSSKGMKVGTVASGQAQPDTGFRPESDSTYSEWEAKVLMHQAPASEWRKALASWAARLKAWEKELKQLKAWEKERAKLPLREKQLRGTAQTLLNREQDFRAAGMDPGELGIDPFPDEDRFHPTAAGPSAWEMDVTSGTKPLSAWESALSAWEQHQEEWDDALSVAENKAMDTFADREGLLQECANNLRDREEALRSAGIDLAALQMEPFPDETRFLPTATGGSAWQMEVRQNEVSLAAWESALSDWEEHQRKWDDALARLEDELEPETESEPED